MANQSQPLRSEITGMAMEATDMLTGLFNAILREAEDYSEIKRLAKTGSYLGNDYFGLFDSINDDVKIVEEKANDDSV